MTDQQKILDSRKAPAAPLNKPSPLSKAEVINELSACLALVRPVSMGTEMATEWLTVAATEVEAFATLRPTMFREACGIARRECTHHGQIIPKILANQRYKWEMTDEPLRLPSKEVKELPAPETQALIASAAKALSVG